MRFTILLAVLLTTGVAQAAPSPDGKALYTQHCQSCHGPKGLGDGPNAAALDGKPGNLASPNYKVGESDKAVLKVIVDGVRGTPMEAFGQKLSQAECKALVAYCKKLRGGK